MFNQTIALFRYQLVGILNRKVFVVLLAVVVAAFMFSRFVAELAIINSDSIALASLADLLRYSLMLMLVIVLLVAVTVAVHAFGTVYWIRYLGRHYTEADGELKAHKTLPALTWTAVWTCFRPTATSRAASPSSPSTARTR